MAKSAHNNSLVENLNNLLVTVRKKEAFAKSPAIRET